MTVSPVQHNTQHTAGSAAGQGDMQQRAVQARLGRANASDTASQRDVKRLPLCWWWCLLQVLPCSWAMYRARCALRQRRW
jgi:hypothetical protein